MILQDSTNIYVRVYTLKKSPYFISSHWLPNDPVNLFVPLPLMHKALHQLKRNETCITCCMVIPSLSILTPQNWLFLRTWTPAIQVQTLLLEGPIIPPNPNRPNQPSWGFQPDCWVSAPRCTQKCCAPATPNVLLYGNILGCSLRHDSRSTWLYMMAPP